MVPFYVRDHVKSWMAFSFKLQLFELNLMVGAKLHSCSSSHFRSNSMSENIIILGDSMKMDRKTCWVVLPRKSHLLVPDQVGLNSQAILFSGSI